MNTEADKWEQAEVEDDFEETDDDAHVDTIVMTEMPVTEGAADTAELKVDKLIEQVEAQNEADVHRRKKVRQRLEELSEELSIEDTFAFDVEDGD